MGDEQASGITGRTGAGDTVLDTPATEQHTQDDKQASSEEMGKGGEGERLEEASEKCREGSVIRQNRETVGKMGHFSRNLEEKGILSSRGMEKAARQQAGGDDGERSNVEMKAATPGVTGKEGVTVAMKDQRQFLMKEAFIRDIARLPGKAMHQIMDKITLLTHDPLPDGDIKIQLNNHPGKPYRLRSGDYRIFYTFNAQCVYLFKIERRSEGTYRDIISAEELPDKEVWQDLVNDGVKDEPEGEVIRAYWERTFEQPPASRELPEPITSELLRQLEIDPHYDARLMRIKDEDGIFNCPGIDDDARVTLHDHMFGQPLIEAMQQPDLILNDIDDLVRYKEKELLAFLLKLAPEQEKYASWPLNAKGPTLVKGGPGTGKSTVALYRIRSLLTQLLKDGKSAPRILFTTYTNALVKSSQQLLQQLLGADARYVRVDTADRIAYSILDSLGQARKPAIIDGEELRDITQHAITTVKFEGNALQQQAQRQTVQRIGLDYLLQELTTVIIARQLGSLEEYRQTPRPGRKVRLNSTQRTAIWKVYELWTDLLRKQEKETWQQRRARAEQLAEQSTWYHHYDAVVIDEAQDLDPGTLRLLVELSKAPNRVFVTADANQSIYGSGFSWSDVHADLRFQGRTSILRANYRSTAEIGEAAQSYLSGGALESEDIERQYVNNGPMPDVRAILDHQYEARLLVSYFQKACRSLRMTLSSCAVFCPTDYAGKSIANALSEQGLEATYMTGHDLNLVKPGIKVMTLKSSKGLEFPIVALAGFTLSRYPQTGQGHEEESAELLARERRTMFVGMTRAMRALLVVIPHIERGGEIGGIKGVLEGFDPSFWNFTRNI